MVEVTRPEEEVEQDHLWDHHSCRMPYVKEDGRASEVQETRARTKRQHSPSPSCPVKKSVRFAGSGG